MAMNFPSSPTVGQTYSVSGGPTYTWDGNVWKVLTPGQQYSPQVFTATAGQTTFTISGGYVIGAIDVFRNGVKLVSGSDYTATDLATVVLSNACSAGDTVEVIKLSQILYSAALKNSNNLSDVSNAATALANLGGLPKAGGTMTGVLDLGAIGQVKFPATQNPSSDANTLDDYEEGTWTPVMAATSGTATVSYSNGYYQKVGNTVTVWFVMAIARNTLSGQLKVTGLPFVATNGAMQYGWDFANPASWNWLVKPQSVLASNGNSYLIIWDSNTSGLVETALATSGCGFCGRVTYQTA